MTTHPPRSIVRGAAWRICCIGLVLGLPSGRPAETAASERPDDIVRLDPLRVRSRPITCFGLALRIFVHPQSRQVACIVVEHVLADSEAAARGLRPGALILTANGRDVRTLRAPFTAGTDFARLFINRRRGDRITLEIQPAPNETPRRITLTQGLTAHDSLPWERRGDCW